VLAVPLLSSNLRLCSSKPWLCFRSGLPHRCFPSKTTAQLESANAPHADPVKYPTLATGMYSPQTEEPSKILQSVTTNVLAGTTVALAMVPEALSFSVMLGMSPILGMQTAAVMAICAALFGSQPSSVTGAAGATAVVLVPLSAAYGTAYIPATVLLAGILQVWPDCMIKHNIAEPSQELSGPLRTA
jgi:hypothetical protein